MNTAEAVAGAVNMTWLDWAVIGVPFVVVLWVALALRRYLKSVADFLAASRCAGRYLICTAGAETGAAITGTVATLETFSSTGFSLQFWGFTSFITFLMALSGVIGYRFRQTRAMTFHQFFEMRYSKGIRAFASFMNFFSGLFNFGMLPAVGARFFVYFCGFPPTIQLGPWTVQTFVVIMFILMGLSMFMMLTGGQISVMVTDCLEGVISGVFYLVVAIAIVYALSYAQMRTVLLSGAPGQSFINPLDISKRPNFGPMYIVLGLAMNLYFYRGNAWLPGFAAAARNPHEAKMAGVLSQWRAFGSLAMAVLLSLGAFTLLHHSDFAAQAAAVDARVASAGTPQLATQMRMPVALSILLPVGVKGAFCAIGLFGLLAGFGSSMHIFGSAFVQDVVLPFRKRPLGPKEHILWLRLSAAGVGVFAFFFSWWFKPPDYLALMGSLIGALYLCVGATVWGGLYWKKGTTAGAWASMGLGVFLSSIGLVLMMWWPSVNPLFISASEMLGRAGWADYLSQHPDKCPLNPQHLAAFAFLGAGLAYVIVSLLTCRRNFDMDQMLHRGKYRVVEPDMETAVSDRPKSWIAKIVGIDKNYTRGDKAIAIGIFSWTLFWQLTALGVLAWNFTVGRLSDSWWCRFTFIQSVWSTLVLAVITTVWFTIGGTRDILALVRSLKMVKANDADDGTVMDGHNAGDVQPPTEAVRPTAAQIMVVPAQKATAPRILSVNPLFTDSYAEEPTTEEPETDTKVEPEA